MTIRGFDNLQRNTHHALLDLPSGVRYEFMEADLLDAASVRRALNGVTHVVHLAALVQTPFSFGDPTWTEHVNHWATAQLAEHCLEAGVERIVYASSASVYGPGGPFTESATCRPFGPYSQSKLRGEEALLAAAGRGLHVTVVRLGTIYGNAPAMRFDAVPNRFAYLAAIGRAVTIHGSGEQVRALVHVDDACAAIRFMLAHPDATKNEVFNWSTDNVTVAAIADAVRSVHPAADVRFTDQHALAHFSLAVDSSKAAGLGMRAAVDLETGMRGVTERFAHLQRPGERILELVD
jgi:UDP-glucose 4-epimerase